MAMGIVSDKDFNKEKSTLESPVPIVENGAKIQIIEKGRGKGNIEVPESLRKIIGSTSIEEGRQAALDLSNEFGISASSTSAYKNGSTSTRSYNKPDIDLRNHINGTKERISKRATHKLHLALNSLTQDKLNESKARDISSVARDMSTIIKNMEPEKEETKVNEVNGPTFVFYAPPPSREDTFDVIYSKE